MKKYSVLALIIMMTGFFNTYALIQSTISDEDREEVCQLINDIDILKTQETEQAWYDFLETHQYFVQLMIRQINVLVYKYPFNHTVQDLVEVRNYLQDEMAHFGL